MTNQVLAVVRTGVHQTEFREYPMPQVSEDSALLKLEVAGICGMDVKFYAKAIALKGWAKAAQGEVEEGIARMQEGWR